jgi:DNA-binding LytR/AlgR family response regulator
VKRRINQLINLLNEELKLFLSISFGVFLFVLLFQPFPLDVFDFNNRIIFVGGLGAIIFVFMVLVRVAFPWFIQNSEQRKLDPAIPSYIGTFIVWVLTSLALPFYLHFVGSINISFFLMVKVITICLSPAIALRLNDMIQGMRAQNEALIIEKKIIQKQLEKYEEDYLNKTIEFFSESRNENLNLQVADVAFIKSADNYVEIAYTEGNICKKKLIRNTLKNIEQQIRPYSNFIRCHRICIVNMHFIEKLSNNYNNHWLTIKGFNEQIPVSRQYMLKLRESL